MKGLDTISGRPLLIWMLLCATFALAGAAAPARAQSGQPAVSARLSTGVAKLGSDVRLLVEVEGAEVAQIDALPAVEGLRFGPVGSPSTEDRISLYNGRRTMSRKLSWVIAIQPAEKGEYTIPPITVRAGGRTLATRELSLKVVADLQGEDLGFFEIDAPDQVFEGEPFLLEMRFGWDSGVDSSVNYANLSLPWLGELSGVVELDVPGPPGGSTIELGLNSRATIRAEPLAPRTVDKRTFRVLRIRKRFLASRSGKLEFTTSHLEFGQTQAGDFFGMRQTPTKRYFKRFPGFEIDVEKLPEEGRPLDFGGAVGTIAVNANPDRRDVDAGDSIKLAVEWTGNGNLEFFEPPDPARNEAFQDFRVYGTTDRKSPERRVVVYDLAPISPTVQSIPPISLRVFDTEKKEYVTVATEAIPIRVRPLKKGANLAVEPRAGAPVLDIHDIQTGSQGSADRREIARPGGGTVALVLAAVPLAWLGLRTVVRRRADPDAPRERARRRARRILRRELAEAGTASAQARALQRFLAARTGEREQAWVGRDVRAWADEHGAGRAAEEDVRALARVLDALDERTYAGSDEPLERSEILGIADRLAGGGL